MTDRHKGAPGALAVRKHPRGERAVAVGLVGVLLASCSPAVHPSYPHARYDTIEQCENNARRRNDDPTQCEKHVDLGYTMENVAATVMVGIYIAIVGPLVFIGIALIALSEGSKSPDPADTRPASPSPDGGHFGP